MVNIKPRTGEQWNRSVERWRQRDERHRIYDGLLQQKVSPGTALQFLVEQRKEALKKSDAHKTSLNHAEDRIEKELWPEIEQYWREHWQPWMGITGSTIPLPLVVLKSATFRNLSPDAKVLYLCLAAQLADGTKNGSLDATLPYLRRHFGWSNRPTARAKALRQLLKAGLVKCTKGKPESGSARYEVYGIPIANQ